jgi:uncharacterized iron-regulated membrane protein
MLRLTRKYIFAFRIICVIDPILWGILVRSVFSLIHRWAGLTIAGFLFMSGLTGAVISWDHELDEALNADLISATGAGPSLPPLDLARDIEARYPHAQVTFIPLVAEAGKSLAFGVEPRVDPATGKPFDLGFNQVFVDPAGGEELGKREWGAAWPVNRQNFVSFLYVLHYTLHIPEMWGIDRWGIWLMGIIAMIWAVDCFVGFYLTLPVRHVADPNRAPSVARVLQKSWWSRWKSAWKIKTTGSRYRLNFDIHRAFGLWLWGVLFTLAFTAFSLNLYSEIFFPVMSKISQVTPTPFDVRTPRAPDDPIVPKVGYAQVIAAAEADAKRRGWDEPAGSTFYSPDFGVYVVSFFYPGDDHGAAGVGPASLAYDGQDGRYLGDRVPWKGTAADIFVQAQFPLHSGRILGLPGRILVSFMGLATAILSVTGVVIWWRKRAARVRRDQGLRSLPAPAPAE